MYAKVNKQVMTLIEETATSEMTIVNLWLPAAVVNHFSLTPPILSLAAVYFMSWFIIRIHYW